jgi:hypothetical protein
MIRDDSPFNIHAARRLETIRLSMLMEESAVQRETVLNALLRAAAARGGTMSGPMSPERAQAEAVLVKLSERGALPEDYVYPARWAKTT